MEKNGDGRWNEELQEAENIATEISELLPMATDGLIELEVLAAAIAARVPEFTQRNAE